MMKFLPSVIIEQQAVIFKFWLDGCINDGLRFQNSLFRHIHSFSSYQRDQAYAVGYALAEQKIRTVITFSTKGYRVWVDLKIPSEEKDSLDRSKEESFLVASC